MKRLVALVLCGVIGLGGCASKSSNQGVAPSGIEKGSYQTPEADPMVVKELGRTADEINMTMKRLLTLRQENRPSVHIAKPPESGPLSTRLTIPNWSGRIEPIVRKIAGAIGVEFEARGTNRTTPVTVNISFDNKPAYTVLEEIGLQAGDNAGLVLEKTDSGDLMIVLVFDGGKQVEKP